ncbi:MAG: c-type cytochrome [Sphingomicrobium sp.]
MKRTILAFAALAGLAGCGPEPQARHTPKVAALAFDGAQVLGAATQAKRGERLTWVLGCHGCHGKTLEGQRFYELYATNLTRKLPQLSDSEFERILRHGTYKNDQLWGMPAEIFQHLSAPDMKSVLSYLRTFKPTGPPDQARLPWEAEAAVLIAENKLKPVATVVRETRNLGPVDLGERYALGRYITRVTCAECHGPELKGSPGDTPNLIVAGAYSRREFETLLTKGEAPGGRKIAELMSDVAKNRFSRMTPHERDSLYAYLKARAEAP